MGKKTGVVGIWFTEGKPANEMVDGGTELTVNSSSRWKIKGDCQRGCDCGWWCGRNHRRYRRGMTGHQLPACGIMYFFGRQHGTSHVRWQIAPFGSTKP